MKTLIVEDDFTNRLLLQELLKEYGPTHGAVNGREAVAAFHQALAANQPYTLICLDILMPEMDGQTALRQMRQLEKANNIFSSDGAKVIMTTALEHPKDVIAAFSGLCDAYLIKPIDKAKLLATLRSLHLLT